MLMIDINKITVEECKMYFQQLGLSFINNHGIKLVIEK